VETQDDGQALTASLERVPNCIPLAHVLHRNIRSHHRPMENRLNIRAWLLAACGTLVLQGSIAAARADTLDDIKKKGEMVVGMEAAYVPYEFFKDGKIIGYDCDIAQKIADKIGVKVTFVDTEWNGIIPALYAHKFDVIMSAVTMTKERAEKVSFSMPYGDASVMILLRANDNSIKVADDLSGKPVGSQLGSAPSQVASRFDTKLKAEGKPGFAELKLYDHFPEAYLDLANHRTDAVLNSLSTLQVVMKDQPGKYRMIGGVQDLKAYFGLAFRKDDAALTKLANGVLAEMKSNGELSALQTKWFGATMDSPNEVPAVLP
jgi:polar amino acid transport system substrate-binding protein